ncbi:DUF2288 domain-containing protein [Calothrix sp. UHCC 0171]|uniref:DUF2288 domain-containing protein n=1 Tax=Calothrix sp. UHCC 0171 TaxID=3110245 RepID=UPI002B1EA560|nr:DUF2288 domain-containing protein [Calothrix sp. UHCC 0171]MEA5569631.1 DUF2288 domain-containing protein [Calothrix sp. UHCC 0171]
MPDIRAELSENLDEAEWEWLIPHAQRDAVIVVSQLVDLVDVGVAIASDKTSDVQVWIDEALITKPSNEQLGKWNTNPSQRFHTLIVQPYVLVQEQ